MTEPEYYTHPDLPRIPVGTKVRYTARPDEVDSYQINGAEGFVEDDDGTTVVPYSVRLFVPTVVYGEDGFEASVIAADYDELEVIE